MNERNFTQPTRKKKTTRLGEGNQIIIDRQSEQGKESDRRDGEEEKERHRSRT